MPKKFTVRSGGKTWTLKEAKLYLTDGDGEYNHPSICMEFSAPDIDYPDDETTICVSMEFQRNMVRDDNDRAAGLMDTAKAWSNCYGGRVNLSRNSDRLVIGMKLTHTSEDRMRAAVGKKLSDAAREYNLYAVNPCQCAQMVAAIAKLGGRVEELYAKAPGTGKFVSRWEAPALLGVKFGKNRQLKDDNDRQESDDLIKSTEELCDRLDAAQAAAS